jgi:hypothetical protein
MALRFDPPLIEKAPNPQAFTFWWTSLQAIFEDLSDPREFPPLPHPIDQKEREVVEHFIEKAEQLAASAALNADAGIEVSISGTGDDQTETITANLPAPDLVAGFAAIFRQLYSHRERASFSVVSGILMRHAKKASDAHAELRQTELRRWGKAVGRLRASSVERLAVEKLIEDGEWPAIEELTTGGYPDRESPQQVISIYFSAEHFHWEEEKAKVLAERRLDAFEEARSSLFFLQAAAGLAHVYIGYSVLARSAFGL